MSDYGLLIRNTDGDALINSDTQQPSPFFDSVVPIPNAPASRPQGVFEPYRPITIPFSDRNYSPHVFYEGKTGLFLTAPYIGMSGSAITSISMTADTDPPAATGATARIVIADPDGTLNRSPDTWGLQVWDEEGRPVYDSRNGVINVIDVVGFDLSVPPAGDNTIPQVTLTHRSTPRAFYMLSAVSGGWYRWFSTSGDLFRPGVAKLTDSSAIVRWTRSHWANIGYSNYESYGKFFPSKLLVAELDYSI